MHDSRISQAPIQRAKIDATGIATPTIVAAPDTKAVIRVISGFLIAGGTTTVTFQSASNALTGAMSLVAQTQVPIQECQWGAFQTNAGEDLKLNVAGSGVSVEGWINYQVIGPNQRVN